MQRADIFFAQPSTGSPAALNSGGGIEYIVQTLTGVLYIVYVDTGNDVAFKKSSDGGLSWSNPTIILASTVHAVSVWYDRWSGIAAGLIHIAYTETGGNDTLYRTIDTENSDALSTQTTIFNGVSVVSPGGSLSISRARGGNVYCRTCIDAGAEGGFFRLPNANVPNGAWDAARTINEALATLDMVILLPGFAADNQDMILIFVDASANGLSRQLYDDSANTWSETAIIADASHVEVSPATAFPNFSAFVDLTNSQIVLIAWNAIDTANADLTTWIITESAITAKTDVVTNSTDDQGLCGITLDLQTNYWWAFYGGKSDGSETFSTSMNIYYKISRDSGVTWGAETLASKSLVAFQGLFACPRLSVGAPPVFQMRATTINTYTINVQIDDPALDKWFREVEQPYFQKRLVSPAGQKNISKN